MQFLASNEVLEYPADVLGVVVLLQDECATVSALGPRNKVFFENLSEHNPSDVTFNVHESTHSQSRETPPDHVYNVTASMFQRQKDVISVEFLAVRTTNIGNSIRSKYE